VGNPKRATIRSNNVEYLANELLEIYPGTRLEARRKLAKALASAYLQIGKLRANTDAPSISVNFGTNGIETVVKAIGKKARARRQRSNTESKPILKGKGVGEIVSIDEGRQLLLAGAKPLNPESWAGRILGVGDASEELGIVRGTLNNWRVNKEVIALPKGKHFVYPMEQFSGPEPTKGINEILQIANGNSVAAWQWLKSPHISFRRQPPLKHLIDGEYDKVIAAARRSFD